jgi:quinol-cytochrome oxidoreductase complex cytochrome b subunit
MGKLISKAMEWIQSRIPVSPETLRHASNEPVPGHMKLWWFALGGTPAMLFGGQIATGLLLCVYYQPTIDHAWESVKHITFNVPYGWWVRSLHAWGANLMIAGVALHLMRVFFTGAYRKPRELNWVIGATLFILTLVLGFTGYSLVYEQLSYWGATVATNITEAVPILGPLMAQVLRGGSSIGEATMSRFFILHAAILPSLLLLLVFAHIGLVRLHGVTPFPVKGEPEPRYYQFFPDHFQKEIIVGLSLITFVTCLTIMFPIGLGQHADPLTTPAHIKPEWYFYFTFRWLKMSSLMAGVLGTGAAAGLMVGWPFVDAQIRKRWPGSEISMVFGAAAIVVFLVLTLIEGFS